MALHFELVTPARLVRSDDVHMVVVPGSEGEFGVLEGHAPFMSTIRDGNLAIYKVDKAEPELVPIQGGFAEVSAEGLTVLADVAEAVEDIDRAVLAERIGSLEKHIEKTAPGGELDKLLTRLDHYKDVDRHLNGTAMH